MTGHEALRDRRWLNMPAVHERTDIALTVATKLNTDFWRDTLYGCRRDSGHALLVPVSGNFTAYLTFDGRYEGLYDQAGLMLRQSEARWIKAGIELSGGALNMSVVVTRGASDWSTVALPEATGSQRLRLTRLWGAVIVQFRNTANRWQLLRVCDFPEGHASVGPMACSPQREGFVARFTEFTIEAAIEQALHDDSPAS